jgi:hypothetical protein
VTLKVATVRRLFADFAGMCAIADCPYPIRLPDGTPTVEVAHIASPRPGGVRHDQAVPIEAANDYPNLLLLCPTHHQIIDDLPHEYPADKLRLIRQWHLDRVAAILNNAATTTPKTPVTNRLQKALELWRTERRNPSEKFWHTTFENRPELLAPTVNGRAFTLNSKCYVGGKSVDNTGGNVVDFLAQHSCDLALIEIKPPTMPLVGSEYRTNVFLPSRELTGAIVQALTYRASLLANLPSLRHQSPHLQVHSPTAYVIIGDAEHESLNGQQRHSFELFRRSLKDLIVITYDELFGGIEYQAIWTEPLRGDS